MRCTAAPPGRRYVPGDVCVRCGITHSAVAEVMSARLAASPSHCFTPRWAANDCSTCSVETQAGSRRRNDGSAFAGALRRASGRSVTHESVDTAESVARGVLGTVVFAFVAIAVPLVWRGAPLADDFNNCVAATGARARLGS